VQYGKVQAGNVASLVGEDGDMLRICRFIVSNQSVAPVTFTLQARLTQTPSGSGSTAEPAPPLAAPSASGSTSTTGEPAPTTPSARPPPPLLQAWPNSKPSPGAT